VESLHSAYKERLNVDGECFLNSLKSIVLAASSGLQTTERCNGAVLNDVPVNGVPCRVVILGYNTNGNNVTFHVFGKDIGRECTSTTMRFGENERKLSFGPFGVHGTFGSAPYTKLDIDSVFDNISTKQELLGIVLTVLESFKEF
jgi:hypothetical protein